MIHTGQEQRVENTQCDDKGPTERRGQEQDNELAVEERWRETKNKLAGTRLGAAYIFLPSPRCPSDIGSPKPIMDDLSNCMATHIWSPLNTTTATNCSIANQVALQTLPSLIPPPLRRRNTASPTKIVVLTIFVTHTHSLSTTAVFSLS
ncbi:hypothetical protein E2C01_098662 [Portunus trituberculatus]|uniref:Uncharacterized protein n=1 Tax=Portunus trituberculatus TaxID=210409 RepID=A0A5B7KEQ3_PORTR|nr:hypothetical protein [Portunus trituberculatus]